MFDHVGKIVYPVLLVNMDQMMEAVIEAGAKDLVSDESEYIIYTDIEAFSECLEHLTKIFDTPIESGLEWVAQNTMLIEDEEKATKLFKLIDALEESDDIQKVFGNYELSEELYKKFSDQH